MSLSNVRILIYPLVKTLDTSFLCDVITDNNKIQDKFEKYQNISVSYLELSYDKLCWCSINTYDKRQVNFILTLMTFPIL
jgi:hypothetical protein